MEKVYFDSAHQRLVYVDKKADQDLWNQTWLSDENIESSIKKDNTFVSSYTKKYLSSGSTIMEGGCGNGHHVYALRNNGYKAFGIDYAESTVRTVNKIVPNIDIRVGDVFNLPIEDNSIDAYWSLGVIEHYYDGYQGITEEMVRTITLLWCVFSKRMLPP